MSIFSRALQLKIHPQQGFKRLACIEVHLGPSTPSELSTTAELLNHAHTPKRLLPEKVNHGKINMEPRNEPFSMSIFQGCSLFRSETPPGVSVQMSRCQLELLTFSCFEDFHPFCLKNPTALRRLKKSSPNMFHHGSTTDWSLEVSKHIALQELDLMIKPYFFAYLSTQNLGCTSKLCIIHHIYISIPYIHSIIMYALHLVLFFFQPIHS